MASRIIPQEAGESLAVSSWQPQHVVDVGCGCELGITTDDGCFVVLYPINSSQWRPSTHIPRKVAEKIGELAKSLPDYK